MKDTIFFLIVALILLFGMTMGGAFFSCSSQQQMAVISSDTTYCMVIYYKQEPGQMRVVERHGYVVCQGNRLTSVVAENKEIPPDRFIGITPLKSQNP